MSFKSRSDARIRGIQSCGLGPCHQCKERVSRDNGGTYLKSDCGQHQEWFCYRCIVRFIKGAARPRRAYRIPSIAEIPASFRLPEAA